MAMNTLPFGAEMTHSVSENRAYLVVTCLLGWFTISYIPMCVYLLTTLFCDGCEINKYIRYLEKFYTT